VGGRGGRGIRVRGGGGFVEGGIRKEGVRRGGGLGVWEDRSGEWLVSLGGRDGKKGVGGRGRRGENVRVKGESSSWGEKRLGRIKMAGPRRGGGVGLGRRGLGGCV